MTRQDSRTGFGARSGLVDGERISSRCAAQRWWSSSVSFDGPESRARAERRPCCACFGCRASPSTWSKPWPTCSDHRLGTRGAHQGSPAGGPAGSGTRGRPLRPLRPGLLTTENPLSESSESRRRGTPARNPGGWARARARNMRTENAHLAPGSPNLLRQRDLRRGLSSRAEPPCSPPATPPSAPQRRWWLPE